MRARRNRMLGRNAARRRGVSSVLAMMFLVLFGSLAACMAVVAQGNLRTADSALSVSRAMSAAETGMTLAVRRLKEQAGRFVVEKGVIDGDFGAELWLGTLEEGEFEVLDPDGYAEDSPPDGIMEALLYVHQEVDAHAFDAEPGDELLPSADEDLGVLVCKPIRLGGEDGSPYFRIRYEMLDGEAAIRITSIGVDQDITRTLQLDLALTKKIEYAIVSPNRIMIGKNVLVQGPLGSTYGIVEGELDTPNGDPIVMRSDFFYLADDLDELLNAYFAIVTASDVDGDGRMRPDHPEEGPAILADDRMEDYDGDEYIDDFDLFLAFYDADDDGVVCYDADLASDAGLGALTAEFDVDLQLARLIDDAIPDRDYDGEAGTDTDVGLGWHDGVLDGADLYGKVTSTERISGRIALRVARADWDAANGASYQTVVQGPIRPSGDVAPIVFDADERVLLSLDTSMFDDSAAWFADHVAGSTDFEDQVADGVSGGGEHVAPEDADWEPVPFGSTGAYDWYQRPIYRNMTFRNVLIPRGTNALFENCIFVGVTYVDSETDCVDPNWNYAGAMGPVEEDGVVTYEPRFDVSAMLDGAEVDDTRVHSNSIRFADCTFLGSIAGERIAEYTHWRNKIQMTGNTRFYLDPEDEELLAQDDAEALLALLEEIDEDDRVEMAKSSILMPGWSVDVGNFANEQGDSPEETPTVQLRGTIVAGILDVRGTADVFGTLLMTFRPTTGAGPLFYGGQTDAFNTTIGYFGPADGDSEGAGPDDEGFNGFGEIRLRYDPDALLPDGIPWPVTIQAIESTYVEGGVG